MKLPFEAFKKACPEVDEGLIGEHLARLGERYFSSFSEEELFRHLRGLSALSPEEPAQVLMGTRRDGQIDCTVLAFDYPWEFSLITGTLAAMGLNIQSGDVFTYARDPEEKGGSSPAKGLSDGRQGRELLKRRRIIDHFTGTRDSALPLLAVFEPHVVVLPTVAASGRRHRLFVFLGPEASCGPVGPGTYCADLY